jgi:hypothetical protein
MYFLFPLEMNLIVSRPHYRLPYVSGCPAPTVQKPPFRPQIAANPFGERSGLIVSANGMRLNVVQDDNANVWAESLRNIVTILFSTPNVRH